MKNSEEVNYDFHSLSYIHTHALMHAYIHMHTEKKMKMDQRPCLSKGKISHHWYPWTWLALFGPYCSKSLQHQQVQPLTAQCPLSQCLYVLFIPISGMALNQAMPWTDIKKYCLSINFKWPFNLHVNLYCMKMHHFVIGSERKGRLKEVTEGRLVFNLLETTLQKCTGCL